MGMGIITTVCWGTDRKAQKAKKTEEPLDFQVVPRDSVTFVTWIVGLPSTYTEHQGQKSRESDIPVPAWRPRYLATVVERREPEEDQRHLPPLRIPGLNRITSP